MTGTFTHVPPSGYAPVDRVTRASSRIIGGILGAGHVYGYMVDLHHWQRVMFWIAALVCQRLLSICSS